VPAIEGEIRHHLRDRTQLVRTPRPSSSCRARPPRQVEIGAREDACPSPAEVAEAVGASEEEVAEAPALARADGRARARARAAAPDDFADERACCRRA
jgi:DNA-directed RNA polymerase specialized sigma subunit